MFTLNDLIKKEITVSFGHLKGVEIKKRKWEMFLGISIKLITSSLLDLVSKAMKDDLGSIRRLMISLHAWPQEKPVPHEGRCTIMIP